MATNVKGKVDNEMIIVIQNMLRDGYTREKGQP